MFDAEPEGWSRIRLRDLFKERKERGYDGLPIASVSIDSGLVLRSTLDRRVDSALAPEEHALVKEHDVVYNMMRMWQGACGLAKSDCLVSPAYVVMTPTSAILPDFALEMLRSPAVVKLLHAYSHGVVDDRLRLYPDAFGQIPVNLPPLDEQRRIAEVLRSVDEAIAVGEAAARQAFEVLKQTMVASLHLEGGEVTKKGWQVARLGDLGKVQAGRQRAPSFTKGELRPYLRVANVFDGFIDTSDVLEMPFTEREYLEYRLLPEDILLNEGQSIELVGRAAMYLGDPSDCCFQNTLVRFRASSVPASFAYALIRTLFWTGRLSEIASRTTSVAHLGVARFADMRVALPPADEQFRIGEVFNDLCAAHDSHRMANERLRDTRRSIINDLLTGRVRVPA